MATKITKQVLETAGYRAFPANHKGEWCTGAYQKVIHTSDGELKAYFLTFYCWCFPTPVPSPSVSVDVALYQNTGLSGPGETDVRIEVLIGPDTTLEQVEAFYADLYQKLGCVPDIHNN